MQKTQKIEKHIKVSINKWQNNTLKTQPHTVYLQHQQEGGDISIHRRPMIHPKTGYDKCLPEKRRQTHIKPPDSRLDKPCVRSLITASRGGQLHCFGHVLRLITLTAPRVA